MSKEPIIPADPADEEDFDVSIEAMDRGQRARRVRRARKALGLSQDAFARKYRVPVGTLRDWEQARSTPPDFVMVYLGVIQRAPDMVAEVAAE